MSTQTLPSFETIEMALSCLKALGTASETHGLLCALFGAGVKIRKQGWISSLLSSHIESGDVMAEDAKKSLERLFDITSAQFEADNCGLQLLLPDDDADMNYRDWETDRKSTRLNSSH